VVKSCEARGISLSDITVDDLSAINPALACLQFAGSVVRRIGKQPDKCWRHGTYARKRSHQYRQKGT